MTPKGFSIAPSLHRQHRNTLRPGVPPQIETRVAQPKMSEIPDLIGAPFRSAAAGSDSKRRGGPRRPTPKQPEASLPALEWLAGEKIQEGLRRPEEWRLTVIPQF